MCFHTASPFWLDERISDPYEELVRPAEEGTVNVLDACQKAGSVRRVVVTSSTAAVINVGGNEPWPADFQYSEKDWNTTSKPMDGVFPEPVCLCYKISCLCQLHLDCICRLLDMHIDGRKLWPSELPWILSVTSLTSAFSILRWYWVRTSSS